MDSCLKNYIKYVSFFFDFILENDSKTDPIIVSQITVYDWEWL